LREFSNDYELVRVRVFKQRRQGEEDKENQRQGGGVRGRKKEKGRGILGIDFLARRERDRK
jgi:hypothetical protein